MFIFGCHSYVSWIANTLIWMNWSLITTWENWHQQNKFCLGQPLWVFRSCWTRIPGWLNPRHGCTDAEAFRCTWEILHMQATGLRDPRSPHNEPGSDPNCSRAVLEINILFGSPVGVPGNHSYYILCDNFENSHIQFAFPSRYRYIYELMYLYTYPSTHSISELAAGGAWEQVEVHLKMTIK